MILCGRFCWVRDSESSQNAVDGIFVVYTLASALVCVCCSSPFDALLLSSRVMFK